MYQLKFTNAYKRGYKLMKKRGANMVLLDDVVEKLQAGEKLAENYRDHGLSGNYQGFRECHIKLDWLPVYLIEDDILTLTLVKTGSHADVFNM